MGVVVVVGDLQILLIRITFDILYLTISVLLENPEQRAWTKGESIAKWSAEHGCYNICMNNIQYNMHIYVIEKNG